MMEIEKNTLSLHLIKYNARFVVTIYMTKKEFLELLGKSAMDLYNDPEKLRKVNAEFESMKMEHPEFFDRVDQLTIGDMTPDELKKMFDYIKDHILKNRMAN